MAKGSASSPTATPTAALKRTSSSTQNMKNQKSILGFFQKSSPATPSNDKPREPASSPAQRAGEARGASTVKPTPKRNFSSFAQDLTPVPSSDLPIPEEDDENEKKVKVRPNVPLFPTSSSANLASSYQSGRDEIQDNAMTPSRRVCKPYMIPNHQSLCLFSFNQAKKKQVSYKESDSEGEDDDEVIFRPSRKGNANGRAAKRRKTSPESEDEFQEAAEAGYSDEGNLDTYSLRTQNIAD